MKHLNPYIKDPISLWRQAIELFKGLIEEYDCKIEINDWYVADGILRSTCRADYNSTLKMIKESEDLREAPTAEHFDYKTLNEMKSIDSMKLGQFDNAIHWLSMDYYHHDRWKQVIDSLGEKIPAKEICDCNINRNWHKLYEILSEAIDKIEAEYNSVNKKS